jgi:hypothetical protein
MSKLIINGEDIEEYFNKTYDYKGHGKGIVSVCISTDKVLEDGYEGNDWIEIKCFCSDVVHTEPYFAEYDFEKIEDITMARVEYIDADGSPKTFWKTFNVYRIITANEIKEIKVYW